MHIFPIYVTYLHSVENMQRTTNHYLLGAITKKMAKLKTL